MSTFDPRPFYDRIVPTVLQVVAVALPLMLLTARPADAAPVPDCAAVGGTSLDVRLAAKADEGVRPFAQFVQRTRIIYQLDVNEAVQRVERHRAAAQACTLASNAKS